MFDSMYEQYLMERENKAVIRNDYGFIIFSIENDVCLIHSIYVRPESRKLNIASKLESLVIDHCHKNSITQVQGFSDITTNNCELGMIGMLKRGYKIHKIENNKEIFYYKDI